MRPFIRPQWNGYPTVTPELLATLDTEMREMLGFGSNVTSSLESLYAKRQGLEPAKPSLVVV